MEAHWSAIADKVGGPPAPRAPELSDFGLNAETFKECKHPRDPLNKPLIALAWIVLPGSALLIFYYFSKSVEVITAISIAFIGGFFVGGLLLFVLATTVRFIVGDRFSKRSLLYPNYLKFIAAEASYSRDFNAWNEDKWKRVRQVREWWVGLDGLTFEKELSTLLHSRGYETQLTKASGDEGVDIILHKDGKTILVQCKAHDKPIGSGPVRDLYGTLMHQGANEAWLVSTRGFSDHATKFADGKPIKLLNISQLL